MTDSITERAYKEIEQKKLVETSELFMELSEEIDRDLAALLEEMPGDLLSQ